MSLTQRLGKRGPFSKVSSAYAKKFKGAGVPENQAEIHAEAIAGLIDEQLATKKDLQILEANVTARIIRWVAAMLVAQAAIVATLVKLL